jgi:hypothetical protein
MAMTIYNFQNPFKVQHVTLQMMCIFGIVKAICSHLILVSTVKLTTANQERKKEREGEGGGRDRGGGRE